MARSYYRGSDPSRALSIDELRHMARRRVPAFAFEYVEGGAEDELTLAWNRRVFESIRLVPNTLVDTTARQQRTALFGAEQPSPLIVAPTGLNGMLHHRGDVAIARAAAAAGIPFTLSTASNARVQDVARETGAQLWMQLYIIKDREMVEALVARAEAAGCQALVLTTDANVFGHREWDRRNYRAPGKLALRNVLDVLAHPRWLFDVVLPHGLPRFENIVDFLPPEARSAGGGVTVVPKLFHPNITWDEVAWLRQRWPRKLIVKGILNLADARKAADLGCDGIVLTNHGGRQLETCISPMEVLPEVARAVGDRLTIILDSGVRRGTDVVKALALGADAVMIGRPLLYGLAAGGEAGVRRAIEILTSEIDRVLGQLGCNSLAELGPQLLADATHCAGGAGPDDRQA